MNAAIRALNRFGLGARPSEASGLTDPRGWLDEQLNGPVASIDGGASIEARTGAFRALRTAQQALQIDGERGPLERAAQEIRSISIADQIRCIERRLVTRRPFVERLVAFWANHLSVSTDKRVVALLAGPYENDAIRPHVFGRFEDLVLSSARHPAMLLYLDNAQSVGPSSPSARRRSREGQERGLNENYARELLELHTVGVEGGYAQTDVNALAHILTGWSVRGLGRMGVDSNIGFVFRKALHDPGARTVLGTRYSARGVEQGEEAIRDLCRHPATARFVSAKLARHFVADEPPEQTVSQLERVFTSTEGDLLEVSKALIRLEAAWRPDLLKYRTPQDWLVAALRALDVDDAGPPLVFALRALRQQLWAPESPKGYSDALRDWADPDGLMNRAELSRSIADRLGSGGRDPAVLVSVVDVDSTSALQQILADSAISRTERQALAIASPAFQWR